jgi:hypothetical protein
MLVGTHYHYNVTVTGSNDNTITHAMDTMQLYSGVRLLMMVATACWEQRISLSSSNTPAATTSLSAGACASLFLSKKPLKFGFVFLHREESTVFLLGCWKRASRESIAFLTLEG